MNENTFRMTRLEDALAGPKGVAVRDGTLNVLVGIEQRLATRLVGMVPRAEYQGIAAALDAVRAARGVLARWYAAD